MLSRDCILVRFSWFGPKQTVWCEKEPKRLKIPTMYHFLPLVRTKASELSDFRGVNSPLKESLTRITCQSMISSILFIRAVCNRQANTFPLSTESPCNDLFFHADDLLCSHDYAD